MPQAISDNLKSAFNRPNPVYKKTIELYRQAWSGSAYVYDSAIDITDYLTEDSSGTIMWKLDKEDYGVFNLDNVTLTFRNDRNQWKQDNPKGLFPSGKLVNQSKIIIKIGAQLADGTYETLRSFTGYISGDPDYNPEEKTVSMTLVSAMSIFEKKSAEEISTLVTDELLGQDSGTEFTTDNNGVGIIVIVKRGTTLGGSTEIKPTTDYTTSDLNKKSLPLKITLLAALTSGEKLYCSYRYWHQDKLMEWLAEQVMTLCGISSYQISPAIFYNSVSNTWTQTEQADWEASSLVNIDTTSNPGSFKRKWFLIDDFSDGNYTSNPVWNVDTGSWSVSSSKLTASPTWGAPARIRLSYLRGKSSGTWSFKMGHVFNYACRTRIRFFATHYIGVYYHGRALSLGYDGSTISLISTQLANYGYTDIETVIASVAGTISITDIMCVSFDKQTGDAKVYKNGTLILSANATNLITNDSLEDFSIYTIPDLPGSGTPPDPPATLTFTFTDLYFTDAPATINTSEYNTDCSLTSVIYDMGSSLTSINNLTNIYTLNNGVIVVSTFTSDSSDFSTGNDTQGWVQIGDTGTIYSAIKRYIKFKVEITATIPADPIMDNMVLEYFTSTTLIDLVNLTNMTCRQVLDLITELPAYEMGFKADDTFIYRPRSTSVPPILDLTSDINIKTVRNLSDGIDRVKNRVVAEFGVYRRVSDASADTDPNSITKYGTREYSVSASNLLPADNVNLAYAVAPTILAYTKTPRRRCTVETKFILHLELGDKVTVYYDEPTALRRWKWGDRDVRYGQADLEYHNDSTLSDRYNLWGVIMRVEGVEFDFQKWTTSFDLVEVLAEA